ncbi:MAG: HD-GYP domain-containing protein [Betaproteobacteria bacterium]|nr:MAG: HD-GYP domain-containing protein [Betaproteobacteria bacterium]
MENSSKVAQGAPAADRYQDMKKVVSVDQLEFGVFISELDRPWTETPFMYQGFVLDSEKQLETLKKYCKQVTIDLDKGLDLPERSDLLTSGTGDKSGATRSRVAEPLGPSVLTAIKHKVTYREKATVDEELPVARTVQHKTELVLREIMGTVRAGKALDAPRVQEAVTSMTDSVVRNPDAMMLLAKLKAKGGHALDRAFGVSIYMLTFGRFLQLPREQLDLLGVLGLLQDVGMTGVPEEVVTKKDPLSKVELMVCRSHIAHSVAILKGTPGLPPEMPELAERHHERYNGSGYPKGLKSEEIGLFGSIAGLVDCFDAMTHPRPYAEVYSPSNALNHLYNSRNVLFDGPLVEQFVQCIGIFPVGALVELNSGEVGIVIAQNLVRRLLPRVMVVLDAKGNPLRPQRILDLANEPKAAPGVPYRIKRTLEQGSVPIDPAEFFL